MIAMKCERNCSYCELGVLCEHPGQPEIGNNAELSATMAESVATMAKSGNDSERYNPVEMMWK